MRIVGGEFKGRKFNPPADKWPTRPTTDFAKEALFNILTNKLDFEDISMLDLFGGTGNHSYEAISRGCDDVTYVDKFPGCVTFVEKTAEVLNIQDRIKVYRSEVFKFLAYNARKYDYVFGGPPYPMPKLETLPDAVFDSDTLANGGLFVLEHDDKHNFEQHSRFIEARKYGLAIFSFFE